MVTTPKDNGLSLMSILDYMNVRLAKPEDAAMITSFSAAMALETEGRRLDLDRFVQMRLERLTHALVQSRVRDPRVAEAQHHEDVVLARAGLARHE